MSIEIKTIKDIDLIYSIVTHKDIFYDIMQGQTEIDKKTLSCGDKLFYLLKIDGEIAGIIIITDTKHDFFMVDIGIFIKFRGKSGFKLGEEAIKKYIEKNGYKNIIARIDKSNRKSLFYSIYYGFRKLFEDNKYYYMRLDYGRYIKRRTNSGVH